MIELSEAREEILYIENESKVRYEFLWDGQLKETFSKLPVGVNAEIDKIRDVLLADFEVTIRFEQFKAGCTSSVYCNDKTIMVRVKKFEPVKFGKGVDVLEGTPTKTGGSNAYPTPYFKEGYCILRFRTKGFPILSHQSYNWKSRIIELKQLTK